MLCKSGVALLLFVLAGAVPADDGEAKPIPPAEAQKHVGQEVDVSRATQIELVKAQP